MLNCYTLFI